MNILGFSSLDPSAFGHDSSVAILDDDSRANINGSFFKTDETIGLTEEIARQVIAHLK